MKTQRFHPFLLLVTLILVVSLACNLSSPDEQTATPVPAQATAVEAAPKADLPTPESQPQAGSASDELLVTTLEDVEKAVVDVGIEGSFRDPEEGWQVNVSYGGSGFIIDPSGIAVTNNHVVTGAALVKVKVYGETEYRNARVLGVSECSDLAVIDIDGEGFKYLAWYDGEPRAGLEVYVAGFPGSAVGVGYTLTKGIISNTSGSLDIKDASVDRVILHTAKVNPGASGSPLVTNDGQVVGVNFASSQQTDENIAIQHSRARELVEVLRTGKDVAALGVNAVGVAGQLNGHDVVGLWVRSVKSGSPADKARVQPADIIVEMEGKVFTQPTMGEYCEVLRAHGPSDILSLTVLRADTMEYWSGQVNGRELEYASTLDGGQSGDSGSTGGEPGGEAGNQSDVPGTFLNVDASQPGEYIYKDEFDVLDNWAYWVQRGKDSGFTQEAANGKFRTHIKDASTYVYYRYEGLSFTDVRLDTSVENLGANTNYTGLFCRYSEDGWYEVNILSSGNFYFYYYDALSGSGYRELYSGASRLIKLGKDINNYTLICKGEELVLGINGTEVQRVSMRAGGNRVLREGQTGIFVSSEDILPVIIEFDYFYASVPN